MNEDRQRMELAGEEAGTASLLQRLEAASDGAGAEPLRLLVVLAHPDDEVLALGARLEGLGASRFLTVTDGAPANGEDARHHGFLTLEAYRAARRDELLAALADAGLGPEVVLPFAGAVADQTACLHMAALAEALAVEIERLRPEAVLTHPYEGGHPDHDACAFAVHAAVRMAGGRVVPVLEAPSYHADGLGGMVVERFLGGEAGASVCELTEAERARKARRLACFGSQAETLGQFPLVREVFRGAPRYDFTQRPHAGRLFYEGFPWGMDGERFCRLAEEALRGLGRVERSR